MTGAEHVIKAAMAVARDVAEGRVQPAALEAAAIEQCRELFAVVHGPEDPLWELHGDVARQYLHAAGMPADELAEWLAVARTREGLPVATPEVSWIEAALAEGADDEDDDPVLGEDELLRRAATAAAAMFPVPPPPV